MYIEPKRFFTRELLLFLVGLGGIVISAVLTGFGGVAIIIAVGISALILLAMIVMFLISIVHLIKYIVDSNKPQGALMYIVNMIFSFIVLAMFVVFYLLIALAGSVVLLPFLA